MSAFKVKQLSTELLQERVRAFRGEKRKLSKQENWIYAVPQRVYFYDDTTFSVLYQERGSSFRNNDIASVHHCFGGDIGLVVYNKDYTEKEVSYVPAVRPDFSINDNSNIGPQAGVFDLDKEVMGDAAQLADYKEFIYIDNDKNGYVLMNDVPGNQENVDAKKALMTRTYTSDDDAFFVKFKPSNSIPARQNLFRGAKTTLWTKASDYDKNTKTLAIIAGTGGAGMSKLRVGKNKSLVWIQIQ